MPKPLSILIVEDVPKEIDLVARELKRAGLAFALHRVDTELAFRRSLEAAPDLIISDIVLPRFDGWQALRIATAAVPEVPFIIVSGKIGEECAIDALKMGATDYVLKTNLARLGPAVSRALQESDAQRTTRRAEQRFRDLVQTSQDWVWELDVDGRYVFCSPGVEAMLGIPAETLVQSHYLDQVYDLDRVMLDGAMRALSATDQRLPILTARWQHADGSYRWLERQVLAVVDARGMIIGFRGTDRDVTERKWQEEKNQRLNRIYRMLNSINTAVLRIQDRAELLAEVCRIARTQGEYALAQILLAEPGTATVRAVAHAGERAEELKDLCIPIRHTTEYHSLTEQAMCTGQPAACNDLARPSARVFRGSELLVWGFHAGAALPLIVDGTVVGTLNLCAREPGVFTPEELGLLRQVAGTLSFALQYLEKEGEAQFLAYFDPMTGLARRSLFCERLARLLAERTAATSTLAVIIFDVQHLGALNDRLGRHGADRLLQLVAERLKGVVSEPLRVGYFGNGCFGIVVGPSSDAEMAAERLPGTLTHLFDEPFRIEGEDVPVMARFGVARFPHDGDHADALLQNAELAVKGAKEAGEKYLHYVRGMNAALLRRMTLEHQLHRALDEGQFALHYQPKIVLASGEIEGAEALLRWNCPGVGLISPAEFIPVLEDTGMIVEVGRWVIEEAVKASCDWRARGLPVTPIAVNVSPVQLKRKSFVPSMLSALQPLISRNLCLDVELTEGALTEDVQGTTEKLRQLAAAGVRIAIDDFGTGYSSLARLSELPLHSLKIDRTFVADLGSSRGRTAVIATVISLAREFKLLTVAEGVETEEQRRMLQALKCDQYQGYLFSKPLAAEDFCRLRLAVQERRLVSATSQ